MKSTYSIVINTEPNRVFYWMDDSQRIMEWVPNIVENEDIEVTDDGVGSTFRQVYEENGRRMEMKGVVTRYEVDRRLACEINGDAFGLVVDYELEDLGGKTKVTQNTIVQFRGFLTRMMMVFMTPFIKKSSLKQLDESFAKLKSLAENGSSA